MYMSDTWCGWPQSSPSNLPSSRCHRNASRQQQQQQLEAAGYPSDASARMGVWPGSNAGCWWGPAWPASGGYAGRHCAPSRVDGSAGVWSAQSIEPGWGSGELKCGVGRERELPRNTMKLSMDFLCMQSPLNDAKKFLFKAICLKL